MCYQGCPGIWILFTLLLPPPPEGPGKKNSRLFFVLYTSMNCVTIEAYPHIKAKTVTSHPSYDILHLMFWFAALHGRVVNGHTVLPCTRSSA